jgi:hypothetical protein
MARQLRIALFFPKKLERFGDALEAQMNGDATGSPLDPRIRLESWKKSEFWGSEPYYPLNQLIRRLHSFDGAIILLGADDFSDDARLGGLKRRLKRALGAKPVVNANVLIEVGACLARFGRKRTFIVSPSALPLPSYFYTKNVTVFEYDDRARDAGSELNSIARQIVEELGTLGYSAYYSDLPAFGLAHGYFNNFIKPTIGMIEGGTPVTLKQPGQEGSETRNFSTVQVLMPYVRNTLLKQAEVAAHQRAIGLLDCSVGATEGGRGKSFFALGFEAPSDTITIVDIPTNLVPIRDAISTVESLWRRDEGGAGTRDIEFEGMLEEREIDNYLRYLEILMERDGMAPGKLVRLEVPNLASVSPDLLRRALGER